VELLILSKSHQNSFASLLATGQSIDVTNFNGRVVARFPAKMGEQQLRMELNQLNPALYILRSGVGSQSVRLVFSPRR
jgi:hypothetical protein